MWISNALVTRRRVTPNLYVPVYRPQPLPLTLTEAAEVPPPLTEAAKAPPPPLEAAKAPPPPPPPPLAKAKAQPPPPPPPPPPPGGGEIQQPSTGSDGALPLKEPSLEQVRMLALYRAQEDNNKHEFLSWLDLMNKSLQEFYDSLQYPIMFTGGSSFLMGTISCVTKAEVSFVFIVPFMLWLFGSTYLVIKKIRRCIQYLDRLKFGEQQLALLVSSLPYGLTRETVHLTIEVNGLPTGTVGQDMTQETAAQPQGTIWQRIGRLFFSIFRRTTITDSKDNSNTIENPSLHNKERFQRDVDGLIHSIDDHISVYGDYCSYYCFVIAVVFACTLFAFLVPVLFYVWLCKVIKFGAFIVYQALEGMWHQNFSI